MSFTYNPKKRKRKKTHGFRVRMATKFGRRVISKRRQKNRAKLTVWFMLPKEYKLKKDNDFKRVFEKGRYSQSDVVKIKFLKNNLKISRFAFLVGLKTSKKAATRNAIRRKMEEIIRLKINQIKIGFDVAVMVNPEISKKDYHEIEESLIVLLQKADLLARS